MRTRPPSWLDRTTPITNGQRVASLLLVTTFWLVAWGAPHALIGAIFVAWLVLQVRTRHRPS